MESSTDQFQLDREILFLLNFKYVGSYFHLVNTGVLVFLYTCQFFFFLDSTFSLCDYSRTFSQTYRLRYTYIYCYVFIHKYTKLPVLAFLLGL